MKCHKNNSNTANSPNAADNSKTSKCSKTVNENIEYNIGIDISKNHVHICSLPDNNYVKLPNTKKDIVAYFKKNFKNKSIAQVVMEATGGYEKNASDTLTNMGFRVTVLNPKRAHYLMVGLGKNPKTDKLDARMLAKVAQQFSKNEEFLPPYTPPPKNQGKLKLLVNRYKQITEDSVCYQNRIDKAEFLGDPSIKSMKKMLKMIEEQKEEQMGLIRTLIDSDPELKAKNAILQSVPGIGIGTSAMLLAYLPELGTCNREEIASLAGLAPHPNDSGLKTGKRNTKCGRTKVKAYWITAMLNVVRFNPKIKEFYNRLVDNGKPKRLALIASMRKLLTILNQMIRKKQKWNEHLQPQKTDSNANQTSQTTTQQPVQNVTAAQIVEVTTTAEPVTKEQVVTSKKASTKKTTGAKSNKVTASVKSVACKQKATTKGTTKTKKSTR